MRFIKWFIRVLSYLLYAFVVLVFMLWLQFPAGSTTKRLEFELNRLTPNLQWKIGSIGLALPADLLLTGIQVGDQNQKTGLFTIESLALRPNLWAYLKERDLSTGYRLSMLSGYVSGQMNLTDDHTDLQYDGYANGIKLDGLKKILQGVDRTVTGTLAGNFTGSGVLHGSGEAEFQGKIKLLKGEIGFQEPVLGMEKLVFNQVSSTLQYKSGRINLSEGRIESRLLAGEFTGSVKPADTLGRSTLKLSGSLIPRPEFLSGLGDDTVVNILKKQLQGGKLPFTVSGTLKEPGIVFTGLPTEINKQLQGGRK